MFTELKQRYTRLTQQFYLKLANDPALRQARLAELQKIRKVYFWTAVILTASPIIGSIVFSILFHKLDVAGPAMWLFPVLFWFNLLMVSEQIQVVRFIDTLPQAAMADAVAAT